MFDWVWDDGYGSSVFDWWADCWFEFDFEWVGEESVYFDWEECCGWGGCEVWRCWVECVWLVVCSDWWVGA